MTHITQTSLPEDRIVIPDVTCDVSVNVGDWVRINSSDIAVKAIADDFDTSKVIGLVEEKSTSTTATILLFGLSQAIFSGLDTQELYFLSDTIAGDMVTKTSLPSNAGSVIVILGQPLNSTQFKVNIQTPIRRAL